MPRYLFITLFLLFCCSRCYSQQGKRFYNAKGQFIADTNLRISKGQLKRFNAIQDTLVKQILNTIEYPGIEQEASITGSIIVSFTITNGNTLKDVKAVKAFPAGPGFVREASRVLNIARIPSVNTKILKDSTYYMAFMFRYGDDIKYFTEGYIIVPSLLSDYITPLSPVIKKWIDSIKIVLNGRWQQLKDFDDAKGNWQWMYKHYNRTSQSGNPNTDTFYVSREIYKHNECPHPDDGNVVCSTGFTYYPGKKMITDVHGVIYLLNSGPLYFSANSYGGGWGVDWGTTGALLYTAKKTYYSGNTNAFVKFPDDTSKYFVFVNNFNTAHSIFMSSFIIGETKKEFKKDTIHKDGGVLIACKPIYIHNRWTPDMSQDSIDYILFSPDSSMPFHKGDTVLLRTEKNTFVDNSNNKRLQYCTVYQYYPFSVRQIEQLVDFHVGSAGYNVMEMRVIRKESFFQKIFHTNRYHDPKEYDSVFQYLKKEKLYARH